MTTPRVTPVSPDSLAQIDAVADLLVRSPAMHALHPHASDRLDAAMRGMRTLFPTVLDSTLGERIAASYLAAL